VQDNAEMAVREMLRDPEVYGNINAPRAVTTSAIIYCLRCLVKRVIPLNQVLIMH
jgi:N-methylhydantoinase B/oxoprolinase/acetone carboxylase alpha subunit